MNYFKNKAIEEANEQHVLPSFQDASLALVREKYWPAVHWELCLGRPEPHDGEYEDFPDPDDFPDDGEPETAFWTGGSGLGWSPFLFTSATAAPRSARGFVAPRRAPELRTMTRRTGDPYDEDILGPILGRDQSDGDYLQTQPIAARVQAAAAGVSHAEGAIRLFPDGASGSAILRALKRQRNGARSRS